MPHWKSLHIERFRRLEDLRLEQMGAVNLLVGRNNSGKTSVLEAMAVACHPSSPINWINTAWEREVKSARTPVLEVLNWMFPHRSPRQNGYEGTVAISGVLNPSPGEQASLMGPDAIRIQADYREFQEVALNSAEPTGDEPAAEEPAGYAGKLTIRVQQGPVGTALGPADEFIHEFRGEKFSVEGERPMLLPHQFVSPVSHRTNQQLLTALDQVLEERRKPELVELLRRFASDVDDIEIRSPQGRRAVIHLHHEGMGHVPLAMEGDGMRRALAFASAAALAKGGVLLLDEVETALHPEALGGMFRFLVETCCETRVQLVVTTHSLEAVDAMLRAHLIPPVWNPPTVASMGWIFFNQPRQLFFLLQRLLSFGAEAFRARVGLPTGGLSLICGSRSLLRVQTSERIPYAGGVSADSPGSRSAPRVMRQKAFLPWKGCRSCLSPPAFRRPNSQRTTASR